jgi:hypothetical protein
LVEYRKTVNAQEPLADVLGRPFLSTPLSHAAQYRSRETDRFQPGAILRRDCRKGFTEKPLLFWVLSVK